MNGALICPVIIIGIFVLVSGKIGGAFAAFLPAALLAFNLYLIEKAAMALSEEEWLKAQIRTRLLRRKLTHMMSEDDETMPKAEQKILKKLTLEIDDADHEEIFPDSGKKI